MSKNKTIYSCIILILFTHLHLSAQNDAYAQFSYISPVPHSELVSPMTNIIIKSKETIEKSSLDEQNIIEVKGTISGLHDGKFILLEDNKTLIFNLGSPFTEGETITVVLNGSKIVASERKIMDLIFHFKISDSWTKNINSLNNVNIEQELKSSNNYARGKVFAGNHLSGLSKKNDLLPTDFPEYSISIINDPSAGYIFMAPIPLPSFIPGHLIIMDNYGVPIFYRTYAGRCMDFKLNGNGVLTYFDSSVSKFYALDSSYAIFDSFKCGNGYITDVHDFQILPNGHSLLMSYDNQTIRMDTIVPGGDAAARVIGLIVQELDVNKNVVFQWRSWDHFNITDATDDIDLTAHTIDYVHGNSIELDFDGNLIISCRHLDEITKISRITGEIIWRFGGKNNQFQFINDTRGFSHQHDARRIPNKNLILFSNGNLLSPPYSSLLEYQLDENNKIATLIWDYSDSSIYSSTMGSTQRLDNGRTIIGWGNNYIPAVTEVKNDGTKTFELYLSSAENYRVYRYPWRTNLLTADTYSIDFKYIPLNTSDTKDLVITNNSSKKAELTSYYSRSTMFSVVSNFPIPLQPYQKKILQIRFSPDSIGEFSDEIHLRMEKEYEIISQVINVLGYSDPTVYLQAENIHPEDYKLRQNFPNPFNPTTTIKYELPELSITTLKVYDVLGNKITTLVNEEKPAGSYNVEFDGSELSSGIYFYKLQVYPTNAGAGIFNKIRKMILIK